MPGKHLALLAALLTCMLVAPTATADIDLTDDGVLKAYADLRLRWESDFDSTAPSGAERRDRDRFRIRARVGFKYQPIDELLVNLRIRYGAQDSQQSPHVTIWQDHGDAGIQDQFVIDRFFAKIKLDEQWSMTIGRDGLAIWKPNEMLWDDDVYVDGLSFSYRDKHNEMDYAINFGAGVLPDGEDDRELAERAVFGFGQLFTEQQLTDAKLIIAQTVLYLQDNSAHSNMVVDDLNFLISYTNIQLVFNVTDGLPLTLGGDLMYNFADGKNSDHRNDKVGGVVYVTLGQLKQPGDWLVGYYFAYIEKWAVPRFFAQDDWHRFGTATQTRSSDFFGHEIRAAYVCQENVQLMARFYVVDTITNREDGMRFRFDVNISF